MMLRSVVFSIALSLGFVSSGVASAATIVTQTTRANVETATGLTGGVVINFEGAAPGYRSQLTQDGVTFSSPTGALGVESQYSGQFNLQGQSLKSVSHSRIDFGFDAPVTGFGFFFGASDLVWTLTAYDALGGLLDTLQIAPTGTSNAGNFYGIVASGIKSARLTTTSADYVAIDDFRTSLAPIGPVGGVPEPATWAMLILGFGAAGVMIRRRRAPDGAVAPVAGLTRGSAGSLTY